MNRIRTWTALAVATLGLAACSSPLDTQPSVTSTADPRYLAGTLASWEALQAAGQAAEDLSAPLAVDEATPGTGAKALVKTGVVVDDNGTPGDPTDDILTITSSGTHWSGFVMTKVVVRPRKPVPAQFATPDTVLNQTVLEKWYPNADTTGAAFADIVTTLKWQLVDSAAVLQSLSRTGERVGFRHATPQVLTLDVEYVAGNEWKKTVKHYSGSVAEGNLLYTESFEHLSAPGSDPVRIKDTVINPDGTLRLYRIIVRDGAGTERISRYTASDILRETVVRTQTPEGWSIGRTLYRADGVTVKKTTTEVVTITQDGDTTHLVRTIMSGDSTYLVTLDVTVTGNTYLVSKTAPDGSVRTWTIVKQDDGAWLITENGVTVTVAPEETV